MSSASPAPPRGPVAPETLTLVALGGAVGASLRWCLELLLPVQGWPWVTLLTNVLGCAALAWLVAHAARHPHPAWVGPAVGTGLLGGFTTFSTYAVQVVVLEGDAGAAALGYLVATPVLCVAAAALVGNLALRPGRVR